MKKDKNILVVMPVKDEHKKTLEQHSQGNKFIYSSYDNVTQEMVQEANVIIGNVDPFYLQEAKNLEWLQLNSAGADPYVKKGVLPEDVILTNATGPMDQALQNICWQSYFPCKRNYIYTEITKINVNGKMKEVSCPYAEEHF